MNRQVKYRQFQSKDAKDLIKIILDTWGFDKGVTNPKQADHIGYAYLYLCMLQTDYTQVAEADGHAVGVIMGSTCGKGVRPWIALKCLYHNAALMFGGTYKKINSQFGSYEQNSDELDRMSGVTNGKFGAEVALFIVSKKFRGCGVGSALFERLNKFFHKKGIQHYYVHTDSACSYEFYERKGMIRQAEVQTDICYAGVGNIKMFVYGK